MSNMAKAKVRTGQIYLSMAADVYVEKGRKMKVIDSQGETGTVELGRPVLDKQTGAVVQEVDFARAKFDVVSDVGPSSSSRRAATVRALTGMASISQDPQDIKVLMAMAMMNMEGEGIADVRDYFRKQMVQLGVLEPTDKDKAEQAQQPPAQPDANAMLLMQTAKKAEHDAALSDAKVALTNAQTIETLAGIDLAREAQAIEQAQALQPQGGPANG
jgi:Phage P22-like portal protein